MNKTQSLIICTLLILFAGVARLYDLGADAPTMFSEASQDFTTDGGYLTLHARTATLFGDWDLLTDSFWKPFKISLVSGLSYILFSFASPSQEMANLSGVLLNLISLIIFLIALSKTAPPRMLTIVAFFLSVSFVLCTYARLPFSENALLFFAALIFLVYTFWFESLLGKVSVGILVGFCALLGKAFGFLMLAGPLASVISGGGEVRRLRSTELLSLLIPPILVTLCFSTFFYSDQGLFAFLVDRGVGEHGYPHSFSSPFGYVENLITFAITGLHKYTPVLSLVAYAALLQLLLGDYGNHKIRKTVIFMVSWIAVWVVALALFNYRPIRYMFVLIIPMSTLAGMFLDGLHGVRIGPLRKFGWWRALLLLMLNWYFVYNVIAGLFIASKDLNLYFKYVWYTLPFGIALTTILLLLIHKVSLSVSRRAAVVVISLVVVSTCYFDGRLFVQWYSSRTRNLTEANHDLEEILNPGAVVAGQYGPCLVIDGSLRSAIYWIRSDHTTEMQQFQRFPGTHLAIAKSDWLQLAARFPEMRAAPLVATYWLRDATVLVLRVSSILSNPAASAYHPSDFELSGEFLSRGQNDSAQYYLDRFLLGHPRNKSALLRECFLARDRMDEVTWRPLVDSLVLNYSTDFWVDIIGSVFYKWLGEHTASTSYQKLSQKYLELAVRYNPSNAEAIRQQYQRTASPNQLFAPARQ